MLLSEVARRSPVPVACGEDYYSAQQFAELLAHDAVHIIQLEPQYLGLTVSKQVCGMVNAANGVTAPHSAQGPLCSLVCAHLNTATPNFFIHEIFDEYNDDWSRRILTRPIEVTDGGKTSHPAIFAAGDATRIPYKQIIAACGDGATAGLSAFNYIERIKGRFGVKADWKKTIGETTYHY